MGLHIKNLKIENFEEVIEVKDSSRSLHAFIAVHDTTFGPALGGIRFLPYTSREEALTDVLRLAEGMTYKSAVADLPIGGGKSVVIWDPRLPKPKEMLQAFAEAINYLGGRYIGAEDMNCSLDDVLTLSEVTNHVLGLPGKGTGDPARFTAWGVFTGIQATAQYLWGDICLKGKKVLVQGAGGVGSKIIEFLFWAGADLYVSDLNEELVEQICHNYGATKVDPGNTYEFSCDIFSPCARGGVINGETIKKLNCKAIVGAANNQLLNFSDDEDIKSRGILYAPDFVANAGGVIDVASAVPPNEHHAQKVLFETEKIFERLIDIYRLADQKNIGPNKAAFEIAKKRLEEKQKAQNALV